MNDGNPVQNTPQGVTKAPDFTTFMRDYQDMVFSTAYRLTTNEAQAEDIAQEVFLKAYEHWDMLGTSPTAGGWLKTVATNLSLNHIQRYRKRWRFFSEFSKSDDGESEEDSPAIDFADTEHVRDGLEASDRREWVERALKQLPEHQRIPLVLYHFEDLPYEEIAERLQVSLSKVKTDILRGRTALARILAETGTRFETFKP